MTDEDKKVVLMAAAIPALVRNDGGFVSVNGVSVARKAKEIAEACLEELGREKGKKKR